MAEVKLNPILQAIQGQLGDVIFKQYGDKIVVAAEAGFERSSADAGAVGTPGAVSAGDAAR